MPLVKCSEMTKEQREEADICMSKHHGNDGYRIEDDAIVVIHKSMAEFKKLELSGGAGYQFSFYDEANNRVSIRHEIAKNKK